METLKQRAIIWAVFGVLGLATVLPATVPAAPLAPVATGSGDVATAQEEPHGEEQSIPLSDRAKTALVWAIIGIAVMAGVGGVLYRVKRKIGGFPENPSWVAPITVMPSRELPDEGDFGDQVPSGQAHAEH
ncbi:MAG TPA: hypothetical protein VIH05_10525 [Tepidiformaceae bacterium]|jgi:hypothetical protein